MSTIINELGSAVDIEVSLSGGRLVRIFVGSDDSCSTWTITMDEANEVRRQLNEVLA